MGHFLKTRIDHSAKTPIYRQLYNHIRAAILAGALPRGAKLPSSRDLAGEFYLSRNTVLGASQQLLAEGYLEGVEGSGTFVARAMPDFLLKGASSRSKPKRLSGSHEPGLSVQALTQLELSKLRSNAVSASHVSPQPFDIGAPSLEGFPRQVWARLVARRARNLSSKSLSYQSEAGYQPLRAAIAAHVAIARQVHCGPEQVVIVSMHGTVSPPLGMCRAAISLIIL